MSYRSRKYPIVSVLIPVFKTEKNLPFLLDSIFKQKNISCAQIIIYCSETSQKKIALFKKKYPNILFLCEKKRTTKLHAINKMLKRANAPHIILSSSDIVWDDNLMKYLFPHIYSRTTLIAVRPIPFITHSFVGKVHKAYWDMHHLVSSMSPKFGELMVFENKVHNLPKLSSADEELIAGLLMKNGCQVVYEPSAVVYNKPPLTLKGLFWQRYRYYAGHKNLYKSIGYCCAALDTKILLCSMMKYGHLYYLSIMCVIEFFVRMRYIIYGDDALNWLR